MSSDNSDKIDSTVTGSIKTANGAVNMFGAIQDILDEISKTGTDLIN